MVKELKNKLKVSDDALGRAMERKRGPFTWLPHWAISRPKKGAKFLSDQDSCRVQSGRGGKGSGGGNGCKDEVGSVGVQ